MWSWFTTPDHKKIAIMYGTTAIVFFVAGGVEALLIRSSSRRPDGTFLSAAAYNQLFTMHGTTMVFLMGMPIAAAFGNYLVPLMIGARDVAFPRLNILGYWIFLFGGLFLYSSFIPGFGGAPNGGWVNYAPLNSTPMSLGFLPGHGPDYWAVGIIMLGIGSVATAVNFIVTILNMRAPGMTLHAHAGVRVDDARRRVPHAVRDAARHRRADPGVHRPQLRRRTSSTRRPVVTRSCTSTCSGSSAIPRCTS